MPQLSQRFYHQWKRHLFMLAQIISGAGFIFSSVWLRHDFQNAPGFVKDAIVTLNSPPVDDGGVISSRVLKVPGPTEFSPLGFKVETKQFRFELEPLTEKNLAVGRKTASLPARKASSKWTLHSIRRHTNEKEWEDVDLIRNEENAISGSVFVELDDGPNAFSLIYKNSHGEQRERLVTVNHTAIP